MIEKLLDWISEHNTVKPNEMARHLGVSEGLVEQMLEDLVRGGYLKKVDPCISRECSACPVSASCTASNTRLWIRTRAR